MIPEASRATKWQNTAAGRVAAGQPFTERVYLSLRHPGGVRSSELGHIPIGDQQEIINYWFLSNYTPNHKEGWDVLERDQGEGIKNGIYVDAGSSGATKDKTPFAIFDSEFGDLVQSDVYASLEGIHVEHAHIWDLLQNRTDEFSNFSDLVEQLTSRLQSLENQLANLRPAYGEIGHNRPPEDDLPLDRQDQAEMEQVISDLRKEIASAQPDLEVIEHSKNSLLRICAETGLWLARKADKGVDAVAAEIGKNSIRLLGIVLVLHYESSAAVSLLDFLARMIMGMGH